MSVEKILFSDLIDLKEKAKEILEVDNKYIYEKDNKLYLMNINFNHINYSNNQAQYIKGTSSGHQGIPTALFERKEVYFYCCSFPHGIPLFPANIKLCYRCNFDSLSSNKDIILKKCTYNNIIGNVKNIEGGKIENLKLSNNEYKEKFYINKQYNGNYRLTKITNLILVKVTFLENFKLHNCSVDNVYISDVDFEKHADFHMSNFKKGLDLNAMYRNEDENQNINFKAINFKGLAVFDDCIFQEKLIFEWVTFESFSHFRRTKFSKGLDLDYTNIQEGMNFFSVEELEKENTSQETYRIIKHNFEKIGNKIEANDYHALELEKRMTNEDTPKLEKLVLKLHHFTSRNGINWLRPLVFILLIGFITAVGIHFSHFIDFLCEPLEHLSYIPKGFNELFQHIYILTKYKDLWNTFPNAIILAFNKFSLGYLYYQFLIAVRKDTRK